MVPTALGIAIQKGWLQDTIRKQGTKVGSVLVSNQRAVRESHFSHTVKNSVRHQGVTYRRSGPRLWAETRV
jgi:ABC-type nitrate/sulfonate/bicarbonate transport system substrate-binding protein